MEIGWSRSEEGFNKRSKEVNYEVKMKNTKNYPPTIANNFHKKILQFQFENQS
jgi:hypothetical protein